MHSTLHTSPLCLVSCVCAVISLTLAIMVTNHHAIITNHHAIFITRFITRFSEKIPLKRGVRQGCPLSALLYVLVIEVLAIHLRLNPNIVGFKVGGEKIVSVHYMDDTTITITQNRCFKEVIKEIQLYESATEAKVNYKKTKGLWTGSWKGRSCLLYTSPSPRDLSTSRMPSSA